MSTRQRSTFEPRTKRWSKADFYRLGDLGFFRDQKAELLEGVIMVASPQIPPHFTVLNRAADRLALVFSTGFHVRRQGPVDLGPHSEPEPDVAVVAGSWEDFAQAHPTIVALILEVSDSTFRSDRRRKGSLYAKAGIQDYWIANLVQWQLEIYRDLQPDATARYGFSYANRTIHALTDEVVALAAPETRILVADLMGRPL